MTTITEPTAIVETARAGRRAALTSLHSRLGHTTKVVSIFDNAFPQRLAEPEFQPVRTAARRPRMMLSDRVAA